MGGQARYGMRAQIDDTTRAAIIADYSAGELSVRQIAKKHGVSPYTPTVIAQAANVPMRAAPADPDALPPPPKLPITTPAAFRQGRECLGLSAAELARELGVSHRTVRSWEQDPIGTDHSRRPNPAAVRLLEHLISVRYPSNAA